MNVHDDEEEEEEDEEEEEEDEEEAEEAEEGEEEEEEQQQQERGELVFASSGSPIRHHRRFAGSHVVNRAMIQVNTHCYYSPSNLYLDILQIFFVACKTEVLGMPVAWRLSASTFLSTLRSFTC